MTVALGRQPLRRKYGFVARGLPWVLVWAPGFLQDCLCRHVVSTAHEVTVITEQVQQHGSDLLMRKHQANSSEESPPIEQHSERSFDKVVAAE